jgi:hypothetical protein
MVGFAAFAAMCCLVWGLPLSAQASSSPSEVQTEPAEPIPGGAKLKGKLNPGGLPTTYYFEYASVTCDEGCTPSRTATGGPLTGTTEQEVPAAEVTGLGTGQYWYHLVATNADGTVEGGLVNFTPGAAPLIESESVSNVTPTDATIEAQINTGGRETTYRVWVGNYPECIEEMMEECDSSAKHPISGTLAGSSSPTRISIDVAHAWHALSPGSSYIYNVDATNSGWAFQGSAYGENKMFTTPAAKAPEIDSESVSHVTPTDATLEAQINTEGLETSYEFHLATPPCPSGCEHLQYIFPLPSGKLLGSSVTQSVSLDLNSAGVTLTPGQRYEYWVTATNAAGTATTLSEEKTFAATSADQPFTAAVPAQGGQPPSDSAPSGSGGSSSTPNVNAPGLQVGKTITLKSLTNAQKLAKALKACAKKPKSRRAACRRQAHKKYGKTARKTG